MTIAITAQRQAVANAYGTAAPYGCLFNGVPATTGAATNELTGGSPAYARVALSWGAATAASPSVITSTAAAFNVASGATVDHAGVCVSGTAGTADVRDTAAVTSQAFASQGTYTLTATYSQT
jgi:hypothetical protein